MPTYVEAGVPNGILGQIRQIPPREHMLPQQQGKPKAKAQLATLPRVVEKILVGKEL